MSVSHTYTFSNEQARAATLKALELRLMDVRGCLASSTEIQHRAHWACEGAAIELAIADLHFPVSVPVAG